MSAQNVFAQTFQSKSWWGILIRVLVWQTDWMQHLHQLTHTNYSKFQWPAVTLLCCCSHCDLETVAAGPHLYWLVLQSFFLFLVIFPAFFSFSLFLFCSVWLCHPPRLPRPSRSSSLPHYLPGWPQRSVHWANLSWIIWSATTEHPLSSCVSCSRDHPASLFSLSLSIHLSLVLTPPNLSAGLSLPMPTLCLCFPFSLYDAIVLSLFPSFILALFATAGLRCASFTTPHHLRHRKHTISTYTKFSHKIKSVLLRQNGDYVR